MESKRYWLKLNKDFLKSPHIKVIKNMPNGKDYVIFYLSLMLESVETVGHLRFSELVPYDEHMLAALTDTNVDIVRGAVKVFAQLGLMEKLDDGTIYMTQVASMTGKECDSASRVRSFRLKREQKALHCNTDVTKCNDNIDKEKDKQRRKKNKESEVLQKFMQLYNNLYGTKFKSTASWEKNAIEWMKTYSTEEIATAIENIKDDPYWKGKMDLTILFRRRNPQGEAVDNIGKMLNIARKSAPKIRVITDPQLPPEVRQKNLEALDETRKSLLAKKII